MTTVPSSNGTFHTDVSGTEAPTDRQLYRETVASVADRAKQVMDVAVHGVPVVLEQKTTIRCKSLHIWGTTSYLHAQ